MKSLLTVLIALTIGTNIDNLSDNFNKTVSEKKLQLITLKVKFKAAQFILIETAKK